MAEHTYLQAIDSRSGEGSPRYLLMAKRNVPIAWLLPFVPADRVAHDRLVCRSADGLARAERRAKAIERVAGPSLRFVLRGFLAFLAEQPSGTLVFDGSELGDHCELDRLLGVVERLDKRVADLELDEWGVERHRKRRVREDHDFEDGDDESIYAFVGGPVDLGRQAAELAWLSPPSKEAGAHAAAIERAFGSFRVVHRPTHPGAPTRYAFTHPSHPGVWFQVSTFDGPDELRIFASNSQQHDERGAMVVDLVRYWIGGEGVDAIRLAKLSAWATHIADHFGLLSSSRQTSEHVDWWHQGGAAAFGAAMPTLGEDLEVARTELRFRLAETIAAFAMSPSRPPFAIDLGAIGHLRLEHVTTPEYEPHIRAQIAVGAGDSTWCAANPKLLVPPAVQALEVVAILREVTDEAGGLVIAWPHLRHFAPVAESLRLRGRCVDPERFTVGFAKASELDVAETAATFVFVGAALITVKADGCRMAFHFSVPADFDKSLQPYVSGWWTARSGDRFASVLRVGHRVWRFDTSGKLLG